jgi:hypothetical protein
MPLLFACFALMAYSQPMVGEAEFYRAKGLQPLIDTSQDGDYSATDYLATHDIVVDKGKVLTLFPGSRVLFTKDTRLIVKGKLVCQGTVAKPVSFGALDNADYFYPIGPEIEARWEGIVLTDSGEIELALAHIDNSKYGITVQTRGSILVLDSVRFVNNKYWNLSIGGDSVLVYSNQYVSYKSLYGKGPAKPPSGLQRFGLYLQTPGGKKVALRVGSATVAVSGVLLAITEQVIAMKYQKKTNDADSTPEANRFKKQGDIAYDLRNVFGIAGMVGAAGFIATFYF